MNSSPEHRIDYKKHIPSLDGLRGFAISLVFLHHYYPRQRFNPLSVLASVGWVGVDVFFVLSGFLITGILFETAHQRHSLRNFFARRSLRLLPLYLVMVAALLVLSGPLHLPLDRRDVLFFAYGANLSGALGIMPEFGPYLRFNHLWSLAVEEQFYLLWAPLVFLLVTKKRIAAICMIGIALAIISRGVGVFVISAHTLYQSLFTRMDSLLCGALVAMGIRGSHADLWLTERRLYCAFGFGLTILGVSFFHSGSLFNERAFTQAVGYVGNDLWCTALLGLALLPHSAVSRWASNSTLRLIGKYSYGLYLLHEIPGPFFDRLLSRAQTLLQPTWLSATLATFLLFVFCLAAAALSFHLIEVPCLRIKRYFAYATPADQIPILPAHGPDLSPTASFTN